MCLTGGFALAMAVDDRVLGLRFRGDKFVPGARFAFLRRELGDAFLAVELEDANPDLVDRPGTRPAPASGDT
ncbi:hypothetical protein [Amycolatopsis samaneae]|uniref:Uncharacterized protein n=1 Tax=Amycolatopsis samaneae TaxID=664691 RepID=A0ABW5GQG2_9PSEU